MSNCHSRVSIGSHEGDIWLRASLDGACMLSVQGLAQDLAQSSLSQDTFIRRSRVRLSTAYMNTARGWSLCKILAPIAIAAGKPW